MPFAGFEDFDSCVRTMTEEEGHDMESAENICGALQAEHKSDHGNVEELRRALERGAGLIADVGVDLVSGVDVPAVDSKWVMTKSGGARKGHDYRAQSPVLLAKDADSDARLSYAAAMIPREPDKEGDVVATPTVEKAAHDFLKNDGGVDTDHSLIDGEGEVVESWVLKQEREFDLPGGETETYGAGTWMVGIEWGKEAWDRIQNGELTGLSIYGMAEHVPLQRRVSAKDLDVPFADGVVVDIVYGAEVAAEKAAEELGMEPVVHEHEFDGRTVFMPGPDHETYVETYNELADSDEEVVSAAAADPDTHKGDAAEPAGMGSEPDGTTDDGDGTADGGDTDDGPTLKDLRAEVADLNETLGEVQEAVTAEKDVQSAAAEIAEEFDGDVAPARVLDLVEAAAGKDMGDVLDAVEGVSPAGEEVANENDMDEDDEEEDEKTSAEKRADEANLSKGSDARDTAATAVATDTTTQGGLSYRELADAQEGDD